MNWNRRKISGLEPGRFYEKSIRFPPHLRNNVLTRYIHHKVHYMGEDCIVAVCGGTGKGKTATAGALAEIVDSNANGNTTFPLFSKKFDSTNFDFNNPVITRENFDYILPNVTYGMRQTRMFWKKMALLSEHRKQATIGRNVIMEECQVWLNSRQFHSRTNMETLGQLLTGRKFGNVHWFTYPKFKRIDSQIKELFHLRLDLGSPNKKEGYFRFKPRILDDLDRNPHGIFFRDYVGSLSYRKDNYFRIRPPSKELFNLLSAKGDFWKDMMRKGLVNQSTGDLIEDPSNVRPEVKLKPSNDNGVRIGVKPTPKPVVNTDFVDGLEAI